MNTDCDKLVMADHLNSNTYEKVEINSDTEIISKLKELIDKHSSCLTENVNNLSKRIRMETQRVLCFTKVS